MNMDRATLIASLAGCVHVAIVCYVLFVALTVSYLGSHPIHLAVGNAIRIGLLFAIGAIPVYLLARGSLALPSVVLLFTTWSTVRDHIVGFRMEPFTTFYFNTIVLLATIGVITLVSLVEFGIRDRLPILSPRPLL